jgi:ribosome maturation factor RimP
MIEKSFIEQTVNEVLADTPVFVVDIKVSTRNKIMVFLDGDDGVPISECVKVSRHIESSLDREKEDFELEVSSVGVDKPLQLPRQYKKNIGRNIQVETASGTKLTGKLINSDDHSITIEKELKKKKKKKDELPEEPVQVIPFSEIEEVKVLVSFKKSLDK